MGSREDYHRIGELVALCATTMRRLSAEQRERGLDCPFRPITYELEALSVEIGDIAKNLPAEWDRDAGADLQS